MNYRIFGALVALAVIGPACHAATSAVQLRKSPAIQVFMQTCVIGNGDLSQVEQLAKGNGLVPATDKQAQRYLAGNSGKVWLSQPAPAAYAVAFTSHILCTVFVHKGNSQEIQKSMEAWLPPKGSGFTYVRKEISDDASIKTTSFTIYREGKPFSRWVISIPTNSSDAQLKAILSYEPL